MRFPKVYGEHKIHKIAPIRKHVAHSIVSVIYLDIWTARFGIIIRIEVLGRYPT